jgi:hypothetical protein
MKIPKSRKQGVIAVMSRWNDAHDALFCSLPNFRHPHFNMSTKTIIIAALLVILLPLSCEQLVRPLPSPHPTHLRIAGTLHRRPQAQAQAQDR